MEKRIEIIEAASEIGAGARGASKGPSHVVELLQQNQSGLLANAKRYKVADLNDNQVDELSPFAKRIGGLSQALEMVSGSVEYALEHNYFPLILTGDHSNAIGSVSGFKNHFAQNRIGVIWVDAHLDLHSPLTTPSGNIHGMALNALIAKDNEKNQRNNPAPNALAEWNKLKSIGSLHISPKVLPENIVFVGVRSYEPEEIALVNELGITLITPKEIEKEGMENCIQKTLKILDDCEKIYVSFDVDSLDPGISRGTGTPVDGGLSMEEAKTVFQTLFHHPKVAAFEITEINPDLDEGDKMAKAVVTLLQSVA